jgi:hypothetical protein
VRAVPFALLLAGLSACGAELGDPAPGSEDDALVQVQQPASRSSPGQLPILYHGGPVMKRPVHLYYIFYGGWSRSRDARDIALYEHFARYIGGSAYYAINTGYSDTQGAVSPTVIYGGKAFDAYSQGKGAKLKPKSTFQIVTRAIRRGALPRDPSAVYVILASPDVVGLLPWIDGKDRDNFCAWHGSGRLEGDALKLAFVYDARHTSPDPTAMSCLYEEHGMPGTATPNDAPGADHTITMVAHELAETVTDPFVTAWYDRYKAEGHWWDEENGDKCEWTFGPTFRVGPRGAPANVMLGGRPFLLQELWINEGGGHCGLSRF